MNGFTVVVLKDSVVVVVVALAVVVDELHALESVLLQIVLTGHVPTVVSKV